MELLQFIESTSLNAKPESERAQLLCFYHYKEAGVQRFTMALISDLMQQCGFSAPNTSRLKDRLTKGKAKVFLIPKATKGELEFIPAILQGMEKDYCSLWVDVETIVSDNELLDEIKFCGKRPFLDKLLKQVNHSYAHNCYDACAVLMRRLFEIMLVLSFQHHNIDDEIKDSAGKGYIMLDGIVKRAQNSSVLKLSRIKNEFDTFRMVGNFSAHNITYTAGKKDIDDIKLNYRVMLEELYSKAGLTT